MLDDKELQFTPVPPPRNMRTAADSSDTPNKQVGPFNGAFFIADNGYQYIENGKVLTAENGPGAYPRKANYLEALERCEKMDGAIRYFQVNEADGSNAQMLKLNTIDIAISQGVIDPPQEDYWENAEQALDEASSIAAYICRNTSALIESDAGKLSKFKYVMNKVVDSAPSKKSFIGLSAGALLYAANGNGLTTGIGVGLMALNAIPAVLSLTFEGIAPLKLRASQALYDKVPSYKQRIDAAIEHAVDTAIGEYTAEHGKYPDVKSFPMSGKIAIGELLQISQPDANAAMLKDVLQSNIQRKEREPINRNHKELERVAQFVNNRTMGR